MWCTTDLVLNPHTQTNIKCTLNEKKKIKKDTINLHPIIKKIKNSMFTLN